MVGDYPVCMESTCDFARRVFAAACEHFGVHPANGLVLRGKKGLKTVGAFVPMDDYITLNLLACRTKRDIVFALGHEVAHAAQNQDTGGQLLFLFQNEVAEYGYDASPLEINADAMGFVFEAGFKYKNEILNKSTPSVFIQRKTMRSALF